MVLNYQRKIFQPFYKRLQNKEPEVKNKNLNERSNHEEIINYYVVNPTCFLFDGLWKKTTNKDEGHS